MRPLRVVRCAICSISVASPTLFVMEGGYAVDEIGINVCNVLAGFENGRTARASI
jgi:acetoin utilization deacetylase AcuC-like enzyme